MLLAKVICLGMILHDAIEQCVFTWFSQSPDLNIIEHILDVSKCKVPLSMFMRNRPVLGAQSGHNRYRL